MASVNNTAQEQQTRILLACDDADIRARVRETLRTAGFSRVLPVTTGRETIGQLQSLPCDLLLTPLNLPDLDARQLISMVRSGRFGPSALPIVVMHPGLPNSLIEKMVTDDYGVPCASTRDPAQLLKAIHAAHLTGCAKRTVLVIEDDHRLARLTQDSLGPDYEVELAYTGEAGLELWNACRHELVLLDFMLPGIKGDEVLKAILAVNPAQPVIIITAYGSLDRHQRLMLNGAVDFLPKPYKVVQLRQACERALRHKEFVETRAQVQEVEGTMHQLANRVHAAEQCLSVGRTWTAYEHLKEALGLCRDMPPNDEEWAEIKHEFE